MFWKSFYEDDIQPEIQVPHPPGKKCTDREIKGWEKSETDRKQLEYQEYQRR